MPAYLFWGEEKFNLENEVKKLRNELLEPGWESLNHKLLDEPEVSDLVDTLRTLPMAFGNILIEVKATSFFMRDKKKLSSSDALMKKFIDVLENLNEKVHVLFVCPIPEGSGKKIDSALKLTKTLAKVGEVKEFPAFKSYQEKELTAWITKRATEKKVKITSDAALTLLQNTGPELRKLDTELEKLKLHAHPEKQISKNHVLALCSNHENIFTLADCWVQNDKSKVAQELSKLLEKDHPIRIIATLQTVVKRWLKIKLESKTKDAFEISKLVNLHKFVVEQDIKKLKSVSEGQLITFRNKLTEAEFKIKSGEIEAELALELAMIS